MGSLDRVDLSEDATADTTKSRHQIAHILGIRYSNLAIAADSLPFAPADATAGSEAEMQTVVVGHKNSVDLPLFIEESNYFLNTKRRAKAGDTSKKFMTDLEKYLNNNPESVWENSWVRFPQDLMGRFASAVFQYDLRADKNNTFAGQRSDRQKFIFDQAGRSHVRIPVSYLLKLALAEIIDPQNKIHPLLQQTGKKLLMNFLNDNTSPETSSFYVVSVRHDGNLGEHAAKEMSLRSLFSQLLVMFANHKYKLAVSGQKAMVFMSPHPPTRQRILSQCISDAFYRELFMNPCLSGWDRGAEKYQYMRLCHSVLSRSQFNATLKLREAGIISSNLVCLPNLSNISLANNGIHVSIGSAKLGTMLKDPNSGFTDREEKYLGDLAVKIVEHFLPLFVGTYSGAPYRLDFTDFHPEKALGFLSHELDFTHLRMLWRRWKKKADLKFLGKSFTPFGPGWLDSIVSRLFRLRGDYIPDYRLIDYLVILMSTDESPALNGELNNWQRLKEDLEALGIFDSSMSLYLLEKLREYSVMGFSGFEGRHYSLFHSFIKDMAPAVNLQNLLYLLAFKYILTGQIKHKHIPDNPFVESERRQIIFGAAIDLPTFFVHHETGNMFMRRIVNKTKRIRMSRRYPGYLRLYQREYKRALIDVLLEDASDLIEMLGTRHEIDDLAVRLDAPETHSVAGKLTSGILNKTGIGSPLHLKAEEFNREAEKYYRHELRKQHIIEAIDILAEEIAALGKAAQSINTDLKSLLHIIGSQQDIGVFLEYAKLEIVNETASVGVIERMLQIIITYVTYRVYEESSVDASSLY